MLSRRRLSALVWRYGNRVRWLLVAACIVLAVATSTTAEDPADPTTVTVASRTVASGATLGPADLSVVTATLPVTTLPPDRLVGEVARGPLEPGEPVTAGRIVPGGSIEPPSGSVVFPLPLSDHRIAALLQSGDRVDVIVTPDALHDGEPRMVATDVEVLTVTGLQETAFGPASSASGAVVLLAVPQEDSGALAAIRTGDHVSVTIR